MGKTRKWAPRFTGKSFDSLVAVSDGCWEWQGAIGTHGYGTFRTKQLAHRVAWETANGPIAPGLFVLHRCDNRRCVRPDHLFLGTNRDNMLDAKAKGRTRGGGAKGERQWNARLTADDVRAIRARRASGEILRTIAADYGLSAGSVHHITSGRSWRHVE